MDTEEVVLKKQQVRDIQSVDETLGCEANELKATHSYKKNRIVQSLPYISFPKINSPSIIKKIFLKKKMSNMIFLNIKCENMFNFISK